MFELARVMGTSVRMIERHYGALLDGAHCGIAARLDAYDVRWNNTNQFCAPCTTGRPLCAAPKHVAQSVQHNLLEPRHMG
jgi:hypothetical protein